MPVILVASPSLAMLILIRCFVSLASLREYVPSSSHLGVISWVGTSETAIAIFWDVEHAFWLHVFIYWRDVWWGGLRRDSVVLLLEARLLLITYHHLLLGLLHVFLPHYMLGSGGPADWTTNWIALIIARSLAVISFFFDNVLLVRLSIFTLDLLLHLNSLRTTLISSIIKASQLFLRLVWSKLAISISLGKNCTYRDSSTHRVNFTLRNQLVCSSGRVIAWSTHSRLACLHLAIDRVLVLTMHLLLVYQILIGEVKVINSCCWLPIVTLWDVALPIEGRELRLVLDEVVLTVLKDCLVVETSDCTHSLALRFSVFVGVFHFLFSVFHVAWSCRLVVIDLAMERTTKNIFWVLDIQPWTVSCRLLACCVILSKSSHEKLIHLLVILVWFSVTLNLKILRVFFVRQIKTSTVGHVHLERAWCKALCLLLIDSCNLFLGVTYWSIVFLWILLDQLILE